jgi:PAS domain S-box-containing protein
LVVAITVAAGSIVLLGLSMLEDHLLNRSGRNLQWAAMEMAEKLDLVLFERYGDIQILADTLPEAGGEQEGAQWTQHLGKVQKAYPVYGWIGLLDKTGRVVAATDSGAVGKDAGAMDLAGQTESKSAVTVHDARSHDLLEEHKTVGFSVPVTVPPQSRRFSPFHGTLVTHIKLSDLDAIVTRTLQEITTKTDVHQRLEYQVLNRHGQVIVESLHQQEGSLDLVALGVQSARLVTAGQTGFVMENHARRPVQVLTGYAPMPARKELQALGWGVLVRADSKAILAPIHSTVRTVTMWGMGIFLPLWLVLLWTMGRLRSEWRRTEVGKHASEEAQHFLQSILDNALDAHILMDHEGLVVGWNLKAEAIFGWPSEEVVGKPLEELIIPPEDREALRRDLTKFPSTGKGLLVDKRFETEGRHREGRPFPIEISSIPVKTSRGNLFSVFIRDITERKLGEAEEVRLWTILNASLNEIYMFRPDTLRFTYVNLGALSNIGYTMEAMQAMTPLDIKPEMTEASFRELVKPLLTGEREKLVFQTVHRRKNESLYPVEVHLQVVGQGQNQTFLALIYDINVRLEQERRQSAEHAIAKILLDSDSLEEASQKIQETVCRALGWKVGVLWKVDEQAQVLRCVAEWKVSRTQAETFLEQTRRSAFPCGVGLPGRVWESGNVEWISDVIHDSNFPRAPFAAEVGFHTGFAFPIRLEEKVYAVMEFFASDIREPERKLLDMFGNLAAQLSQFLRRKMAEVAITAAKAIAEQAVDEKAALLATVEAFFIRLTESGVICEWTSQAEKLFDISLTNAMGCRFQDLPIAMSRETIHEAINRATRTISSVHLDKVRLVTHENTQRFIRLTVSPLCTDSGVDVVLMGEDVTERLDLERELVQAQKLESIGQLAAGIAHEINTPTQFVGDNVRFLSDSFADLLAVLDRNRELLASAKTGICPPGLIEACETEMRRADLDYLTEEIPKAIAQSAEGIERIAKIVRAMKDFAHPGSEEKVGVDLNKAIGSTVEVSRNEWKYVADLTTDLASDLPLVPCLQGQFNQVILNMIVNAAHAIGDRIKSTGQKGIISIMSCRVDDWAEIRITDNGPGIPEHIRHKIFDPFFTTKEVGKGTGQGLAIARSVVVDKHRGTITVESQVGQGTTFIVRLPLNGSGETGEMEQAA